MIIRRWAPPERMGPVVRFQFPWLGGPEATGRGAARASRAAPGAPPAGEAPARPAPAAILTLQAAGDMKYRQGEANALREGFLASLGYGPAETMALELHHTRRVVFARDVAEFRTAASEAAAAGGADGILCADPSCAAVVTVADCMPIWLHDHASGAFGVLHSGWKGTGILAEALSVLRRETGSSPDSVSVILGPSINRCCYAVPADRAARFAWEFGAGTTARERGPGGEERCLIDLRAANLKLAAELGVGGVLDVDWCTACDPRLGSYRRQGPSHFTRMAALCGWIPAAARPPAGA